MLSLSIFKLFLINLLARSEFRETQGKTREIPVQNKETSRVVYVLPETLKKEPERFQKMRPNETGDVRWRGKSKPPQRPTKPYRSEIPRDPPPAPIHPPILPKPVKKPKPVKPVVPLKPPKAPQPSSPHRWKTEKRYLT